MSLLDVNTDLESLGYLQFKCTLGCVQNREKCIEIVKTSFETCMCLIKVAYSIMPYILISNVSLITLQLCNITIYVILRFFDGWNCQVKSSR